MLFNKICLSLPKFPINLSSNFRRCFSSQASNSATISHESFLANIPYNFKGLTASINQQNSFKIYSFLNQIFQEKIDQGFKLAYQSLLEGFVSEDLDLFEETLEPQLYIKVEKALRQCKEKNYSFKLLPLSNDIQVIHNNLDIHSGVLFTRSKNSNSLMKQSLQMFDYATFHIYLSNGNLSVQGLNSRPILQIGVYFTSNQKLYLEDSNGKIIAGSNTNENQTHMVIFETDPGDNQSFGQDQLFGLLGGMTLNSNRQKIFKDIFLGSGSQWKISDIDFALKGNPFSK